MREKRESAWRASAALFFAALAACAQEVKPTEVVVSVRSDLEVGTELARIDVQTHDLTGRLAGKKYTFQLAEKDGSGHRLPFSFGLARGNEQEILLTVTGFAASAGVEQNVVVAYTTRVRFLAEQTLLLDIFLGRACYNKTCEDGSTCDSIGTKSEPAGSCRPVREGPVVIGRPGAEAEDWLDPAERAPDADGGARDGGAGDARAGQLDGRIAPGSSTQLDEASVDPVLPDAETDTPDATPSTQPDATAQRDAARPDAAQPHAGPGDAGGMSCTGSACPGSCSSPMHMCSGQCVANDVAHCGASCAPCAAPANGSSVCDVGVCVRRCDASYHMCGATCASDNAVATCGTRCEPCPAVANGTATCNAGRCGATCNANTSTCGDGTCKPQVWNFEDGTTQGAAYHELNSKARVGALRVSTQRAHGGRYSVAADTNANSTNTNIQVVIPLCAPDVSTKLPGKTFGLWLYFDGTGTLDGDLTYYWVTPSASRVDGDFVLTPNTWIHVTGPVPSTYPEIRSFGFYVYFRQPWMGTIYIDDGAIM